MVEMRPAKTSPVVPSSDIQSPSCSVVPLAVSVWPSTSMSISSAPAMHGLPIWRATTAAWLDEPPREVRMPTAGAMP